MSKSKHTPGPWVIHVWRRDHRTSKGESQPRFQYQVSTMTGEPIEATTKNKANADLIAAAPDLKTALEGLLEFLDRYPHPYPLDIGGYLTQADAAIAKAEGRDE